MVSLNVDIHPLGYNLLHQLASALQQANGLVCLCLAVVGLIGFVKDNHYSVFLQVVP